MQKNKLRKDGGSETEQKDWTKLGQFMFFVFWCLILSILMTMKNTVFLL